MPQFHCFISGASSGVGAALARLAVKAGWHVSICARRLDRLQLLQDELGKEQVEIIAADVSDDTAMEQALQQAHDRFGVVHHVVANAGSSIDGELSEVSSAAFAKLLQVNLLGVHHTVQAAMPFLANKAMITAVASIVSYVSIPRMGAYCATKFALDGYIRCLRMELADRDISVLGVHPGTIATEFFDVAQPAGAAWTYRPGKAMSADYVAICMFKRMQRCRGGHLVLPLQAWLLMWLHKLFPGLVEWTLRRKLRQMRVGASS